MMKRASALTLSLSALPAFAAQQSAYEPFTGAVVLELLLGLGLVVALIFLLAWLLRRVNGLQMRGQQMKIVASTALGTRERAVLLQVGERQLLLGVAPGRVTLLESFPEKIIEPETFKQALAKETGETTSGVEQP